MEEETSPQETATNRLMKSLPHQPTFSDLDLFISDSSGTEASTTERKKHITFAPSDLTKYFQESNSSSSSTSSLDTASTTTTSATSTADVDDDTLLTSYLKKAVILSLQYESSNLLDDIKIKKSQEIIFELSADIAELKEKLLSCDRELSLATFQIFVNQAVSEHFESSLTQALEKIKFLSEELSSSLQIRATQLDEIALLTLELRRNTWHRYTEDYE